MTQTLAVWLLIALAVVAANLPFFTRRVFAVIPWTRSETKPFGIRLLEVMVLYVVVGLVGFLLEGSIGNRFSQDWQFYVTTLCLFLVFAYPGFVWRYLYRRAEAS